MFCIGFDEVVAIQYENGAVETAARRPLSSAVPTTPGLPPAAPDFFSGDVVPALYDGVGR